MGAAGSRRVEQSLSWNVSKQRLLAAYDHVLTRRPPRTGAKSGTGRATPRPIRRREQDAVALGPGRAEPRSELTDRRGRPAVRRPRQGACGGVAAAAARVGRNPARASIEPLGVRAPAATLGCARRLEGPSRAGSMDSDVGSRTRAPKDRLDRRHVDRPVGSPGSGAPTNLGRRVMPPEA
jgi:hypothetical protein